MPLHARVHLLITGLVQGVAFRQSAVFEAERLGLVGWVKNLPDGRVEAEAEGERARVEVFARWCEHGPRGARVEWVDAQWGTATGKDRGFTIVR
ncbi:MAG TPA: acylphosphatase [Anaeromyxobacteraceae bacterium]|nr:acylphosphatase [Anaeromyxobacteraceae bacterium]